MNMNDIDSFELLKTSYPFDKDTTIYEITVYIITLIAICNNSNITKQEQQVVLDRLSSMLLFTRFNLITKLPSDIQDLFHMDMKDDVCCFHRLMKTLNKSTNLLSLVWILIFFINSNKRDINSSKDLMAFINSLDFAISNTSIQERTTKIVTISKRRNIFYDEFKYDPTFTFTRIKAHITYLCEQKYKDTKPNKVYRDSIYSDISCIAVYAFTYMVKYRFEPLVTPIESLHC